MADSKKPAAPDNLEYFFISREKKPSPLGTVVFVGLRAADVVLQYNLLHKGWATEAVSSLGGAVVPFAAPRDPALSYLGLPPYPALIAALALGSATKQIIWALTIKEQEMKPLGGIVIAGFNTIFNTTNTLLSCWVLSSQAPQLSTQSASLSQVITSSPVLMASLGFFITGFITELGSEIQRHIFKSKPENKGKPYGGGLWSLATNINYGGYTLWRAGYSLASGGPAWGLFIGAFFFYDFATRAVPSMDKYCTDRYGQDYEDIKKKTRYRLLPLIY